MCRICTFGEEEIFPLILFLSMSFIVLVILSQFWLFLKIYFWLFILQIALYCHRVKILLFKKYIYFKNSLYYYSFIPPFFLGMPLGHIMADLKKINLNPCLLIEQGSHRMEIYTLSFNFTPQCSVLYALKCPLPTLVQLTGKSVTLFLHQQSLTLNFVLAPTMKQHFGVSLYSSIFLLPNCRNT